MSSQWVDASGNPWRYSTVSQSWQRLLDGSWSPGTPPPGGLQRSATGGPRDVIVAPPWPTQECTPEGQWIDDRGDLWRYSPAVRAWQHFIDGTWLNSAPPSGGLKKLTDAAARSSVVVIDSIGPRGPQGGRGEPGPPGTSVRISEMLSVEYQDGVNTIFPLSNHADLSQAFQVFRNGLMEMQGYGYLVTPTQVTFTTPPLGSDVLTVVYQKAQ